jgi:exopolyphosphatase / guanosine-5'-triphosphate,3'-diphosphate pyrophosphatase
VSVPEDLPVLGPDDAASVAGQLGRTPRDVTGIAVRCPFGFPAVIETAPMMSGGKPNPTLLYLTCPALTADVSGIEAGGGVRAFRAMCREDPILRDTMDEVTRLYRERRAHLAGAHSGDARIEAGIGGPAGPEKASCLHAYAAAFLAVGSGWFSGQGDGGEGALESLVLADRVAEVWATVYPGLHEFWCSDRKCARWAGRARRAVIDVGTISVRLLVSDVGDLEVRDIVRRAEITRLGEGLGDRGRLSQEARERTAAVVGRYVEEARSLGAEAIALAGTSAARDAEDGKAFIDGLGAAHQIPAHVLSGEEEAELTYAGASLDVSAGPVVLDIGGGSTELIRRDANENLDLVSLDLGASRATEGWLTSDPPEAAEVESVYREACRAFDGLRLRYGAEGEPGEVARRTLVGVAGTVTTLACLDAGLKAYDRDFVHLRELTAVTVRRLLADLADLTTAERAALPCVQFGRAGVIVAGAAILLAALDTLGFDRLTVSERDLLDGMIMRHPC